jgi:pSer/pThr/pTyr-binding forkhead associated (FHA) protein
MDVKLIMFKRDGQRKEFQIRRGASSIGRGEECSLRIPLASVSRKHCQLAKDDQALKVRDLGSSNGTFLNNRRITEATLNAGDRLVIGPIVFTVQINGKPEEIRPAKTTAPAAMAEGEDEVIELEADGTDETAPAISEDSDPIAALEALASQNKPKKQPPAGR